jgi:imidazolonepropionase-like amidohydrolase
LVRLLHDNGVSLLAGTDVVKPFFVPGFSLHDELKLLVTAGLSEMEAIQAATRDAARFVGASDVGTIELGMVADFLVLDASPLDSIDNTRRIAGVVSTGRLLEREHLQRILAEIRDDATRWSGIPTGN